jgi:hypothetical protein
MRSTCAAPQSPSWYAHPRDDVVVQGDWDGVSSPEVLEPVQRQRTACWMFLWPTLTDSGVEFIAVDNRNANKLTIHILAAVAPRRHHSGLPATLRLASDLGAHRLKTNLPCAFVHGGERAKR